MQVSHINIESTFKGLCASRYGISWLRSLSILPVYVTHWQVVVRIRCIILLARSELPALTLFVIIDVLFLINFFACSGFFPVNEALDALCRLNIVILTKQLWFFVHQAFVCLIVGVYRIFAGRHFEIIPNSLGEGRGDWPIFIRPQIL